MAESWCARGMAVGDLDGDGRLDVVINNADSKPTVLKNVTAPAGHWLELRLVGDVSRKSPRDAIYQACLLRFRPILMTTLAAALGALPLAIGFGEGAELRRPLGVAIIGGLIASQLMTLLTTPVVYVLLDKLRRRRSAPSRRGDATAVSPEAA